MNILKTKISFKIFDFLSNKKSFQKFGFESILFIVLFTI